MRLGKFKINHYINYIVIGVLTLVLGGMTFAGNRFDNSLLFLLEKVAISIILAVSLSLVVGFLGELSLGHAGFMCVGAYLGGKIASLLVPVLGNGLAAFAISLIAGAAAAAGVAAAAPPSAAMITGERIAVAHIIRLRYMGRSGCFPLTAYAEQGRMCTKKTRPDGRIGDGLSSAPGTRSRWSRLPRSGWTSGQRPCSGCHDRQPG